MTTMIIGHPADQLPEKDMETLAALFFAATGIKPDEATLIKEEIPPQDGRTRTRFYFAPKTTTERTS